MGRLTVPIRISGVACVIALAVLSWLPREMEVRADAFGIPGQIEHVVAYLGTGAIIKLGWSMNRTRWMLVGLVALAAVLEVGQVWVPGRTSQVIDFAASSSGALAGLWAAHAGLHSTRRAA